MYRSFSLRIEVSLGLQKTLITLYLLLLNNYGHKIIQISRKIFCFFLLVSFVKMWNKRRRIFYNLFLLFNHCYFGILWSIFMETYIATVRCLYVQNWFLRRFLFTEKNSGKKRTTLKEIFQLESNENCSTEQHFHFVFPIKSFFFFRENFASIYKNVLYTFISNSCPYVGSL